MDQNLESWSYHFLLKNDGKKWSRLFILKFTQPLQSCCCPVQKYLARMAELAWQLSRCIWRDSVNFKINSWPLFTIIFKLENDNFKTRDFSPLIVLTGVELIVVPIFWAIFGLIFGLFWRIFFDFLLGYFFIAL